MVRPRTDSRSLFRNGSKNKSYAKWKRSDSGLISGKTRDDGISYRAMWEASETKRPFEEWLRIMLPDIKA